jgi:glutaconate CoA-transferase subunit B
MEFEIRTDQAKEVPVPTESELTLLREKCDPQRLIL